MSSDQQKAKQTSRWGSLLSGAVAGLESRLDTILAEDNQASAKSTETKDVALKEEPALQVPPSDAARASPKPRSNDRLQERLAKAMAISTPAFPRTSLGSRPSIDITRPSESSTDLTAMKSDAIIGTTASQALESNTRASVDGTETLSASKLPINPARHSEDGDARKDTDLGVEVNGDLTIEVPTVLPELEVPQRSAAELEAELAQMRKEREDSDKQKQEDMDTVLERIDALQAKLQYLAKESVAAAREANADTERGSTEHTISEKDEKIALLMEEGVALSKTEMRHLATIRKLNAKATTEERTAADLRKDVARLKQSESALRTRIARLEQNERTNTDDLQRLSKAELELTTLTADLDGKQATITTLKRRLEESEKKIDSLESGSQKTSLITDTRRIGDFEEELSNAKIEKKLAEDRSRAEVQRLMRELEQQQNNAQASELELKTEITTLEARMEALRLRAEEASSDQTGDAQAKLLRQIETAQTQYTLASENWRTIEGSLNARLTAVEKERDEAFKRESELRKKARDLGVKCRQLLEEVESSADHTSSINSELSSQKAYIKKLESSLASSEKAFEEARSEFEHQRQTLEAAFSARMEEERQRQPSNSISHSQRSRRTQSPNSIYRKSSAIESLVSAQSRKPMNRGFTNDSTTSLSAYLDRTSRRSSAFNTGESLTSPVLPVSRKPSALSLRQLPTYPTSPPPNDMPPTPSIFTEAPDDEDMEHQSASPRGTVADVISAATVHTGPSVQLVERMSSSIRRLEAEKAARADELARVMGQRDEARSQMVELVREAEERKGVEEKLASVEKDVAGVKERYEACLEMLGEREEECLELKADLVDMKRIYRELVDKMGHE
ncbi:hypothetical protein K461DRAFT_285960 [Myriangium duriaei CBS 260.36]|uniref:TATA element modulatory factor 1 TATA binding domain-containing protein n=1 Tax=Myriangium duriaei CBS 260.36 TaxID=1168546 RepID=A0A9P4J673_9PEZI|nr:hypothetical protein K461DRAFT_285960 [Myriangium duriaei CBS 260.36]